MAPRSDGITFSRSVLLQPVSHERHKIFELLIGKPDGRSQPWLQRHQNRLDWSHIPPISFDAKGLNGSDRFYSERTKVMSCSCSWGLNSLKREITPRASPP